MPKKTSPPLEQFFIRKPRTPFIEQWTTLLGRKPLATDLTLANRNRFLLQQLDDGAKAAQIREMDRMVCKLWTRAFEAGALSNPAPTRAFHYTFLIQSPKPWNKEDFAKLIDPEQHRYPHRQHCTYLASGIPRVDYWITFFRLTQELRLHRSVIRSIRFDQVDAKGGVCDLSDHPFVGFPMPITAATVDCIEAIRYPIREIVLDQQVKRPVENYQYQQTLKRIGVKHRPGGHSKPTKRPPRSKAKRNEVTT